MDVHKSNHLPRGWDQERVRDLIDYYENQTDVEAAAEHEAALSRPDHTLMPIPSELVPEVHELIARHEAKRAGG